MKKVPVTLVIETEIDVLDEYTDNDTEFHLNESSHCISNEVRRLRTEADGEPEDRCFCSAVEAFAGHKLAEIHKRMRATP